jgi:glycosyltransferase involved in cell wall biosynthesis
VGRLVEKKGVAYALEAFARVRARVPEARLRVVGDGPLRGRLEARAEALGVSEAVTFVGVLDAEGVRAEMAAADLLTAPSVTGARGDRESGVIVLKEAAATGLPAVGTRHGGIPEIIEDGTTGFLVGERDVDALASALSALVEDPALRRRMGAAARAKIEREYDTVRQNARLEARLAALL